jgi:hypothetical protein
MTHDREIPFGVGVEVSAALSRALRWFVKVSDEQAREVLVVVNHSSFDLLDRLLYQLRTVGWQRDSSHQISRGPCRLIVTASWLEIVFSRPTLIVDVNVNSATLVAEMGKRGCPIVRPPAGWCA